MRDRIGLCVIVLATTLPFVGKAFHIDDVLYLAVARQIVAKPWDPYGAEVLWEHEPESLFDANFNPPLWNYLMAGVLAVTGEPTATIERAAASDGDAASVRVHCPRTPELAMHLLESVFVAAAIVALYSLARRWVRWPLVATAMVSLSPAMLPGQNVMLEGPVLAFWLWSVWCHLRAIDRDDRRWTWAAGGLAALAVLTKYTSAVVLVVLVLYSIRRRHWRSLLFLVPPAAAIALWSLHNWLVYERLHVLVIVSRTQTGGREPTGIGLGESWGRVLATFRAIGAVTVLALPMFYVTARRLGAWAALTLVVVATGVGWVGKWDMESRLAERGQRLVDVAPARTLGEFAEKYAKSVHAVAFGGLGAFALLSLGLAGRQGRIETTPGSREQSDEWLLWLWLAAVLAFGVFATPFLAVRHLLPGVGPLVWLVLRRLELAAAGQERRGRWLLGVTAALTIACGFLVAKADYDFAGWYRHVAVNRGSRSVAAGRELGRDVWFTGHWGWAYYAERVGMRPYVPGRSEPKGGDFVLMPLIQTWHPVQELHPHLRPLQIISPTPARAETASASLNRAVDWLLGSVRSISTEVHFYSGGTLNLPWQFSRKPLDDFVVYDLKSDPPRGAGSSEPRQSR